MFDPTVSEIDAARILVGELYDDLPQRAERIKILSAIESDFPMSGVIIGGGSHAYIAWTEMRNAFVYGNFLSVVMVSQAFAETFLYFELKDFILRSEIQGDVATIISLPKRPHLDDLIDLCRQNRVISDAVSSGLKRLKEIRNPLTHVRDVENPENLDRRAMDCNSHPTEILFNEARVAVTVAAALISGSAWNEGR